MDELLYYNKIVSPEYIRLVEEVLRKIETYLYDIIGIEHWLLG